VITAQTLRNAASDIEAAERALNLALAECAALKAENASLKDERDEYFRPRVEGDVTVNALRDRSRYSVLFRVQVGNAQIVSAVSEDAFDQEPYLGAALVYVARNSAREMAHLIGEKIAPLLIQAMKDTKP